MPELALHILDLVQNSVSAGAARVTVTIVYDTAQDTLTITIEDDGKGMPPELGIPLFKQLAEMCDGELSIQSTVGKGTKTQARFRASHMDLPPMGDLKGTVETLVIACPERPDFCFIYRVDGDEFVFDTASVRQAVGGLPLNEPEIVGWIGQFVAEGIGEVEKSRAGT